MDSYSLNRTAGPASSQDVASMPVAERALRDLLRYDSWALQKAVWRTPRRN